MAKPNNSNNVRPLYSQLFMVRNGAFFLLIALVLGMILIKGNPLFLLSCCCREILAGFFAIVALLAAVIAVDFSRSWDIFHYIFFRGDAANYWCLTEFEDLMINMYPLHFFLNISIFVAALIALISAVLIAAASLYLHYMRRLPGFAKP